MAFCFEAKADAKVSGLFLLCKFFRDFFRKNLSEMFPESFSRSLAALQGKILGQSGGSLPDSFIMSSLNHFPSRKRIQRYALFSFMQYFRQVFFQENYRFILKYLLINEKSKRFFSMVLQGRICYVLCTHYFNIITGLSILQRMCKDFCFTRERYEKW